MPLIPLPLSTTSNPGRHGHDGTARLINAYAEQRGREGRVEFPLYCIDGLQSLGSLTGSGVRAMLAVEPYLYVVSGRLVSRVDAAGAETVLGGLPSDGPAYMARNRRAPNPQIGIVCDGLYRLIEGGVLTDVSDSDLPPPSSIAHLDGYFIFACSNGRMYASGIDDGASIDALDFAVAESDPDGLVTVHARGRELLALGARSIEFWSNTGETNFPLSRGHSITLGCLAGKTVAAVDQTVAFVAHDGTVRALNGYTAERISNHAGERFIADTSDKATLSATSWSARGHTFYALSSPTGTWVCDLSTGNQWHERRSYGDVRWRVSAVEKLGDMLVAGDASEGALYEMRADVYDEGGDPIEWEVVAPMIHAHPGRMRLNAAHVDIIPGVGLNTTDAHNSTPLLMLDASEDGGLTWGGERSLSAGTINQRLTTLRANRLGLVRSTGKALRFRMSADVVRGLMGVTLDVDKLGA